MKIDIIFYSLEKNRSWLRFFLIPTIMLMIAGVYAFVYLTGGIKYVFSHSMYLPIVLASIAFGARGGVLVALAGGLALGPFMPIDTFTGEQQEVINWLYRTGFFVLISVVVGTTTDIVTTYINRIRWNASHDSMTGLPNMFALKTVIKELLDSDEDERKTTFLLVALLENQRQIAACFGVGFVNGVIAQIADEIQKKLGDSAEVYRIDDERLGFVQSASDEQAGTKLANKFAKVFTKPFEFEGIQIHADVYLGSVAMTDATIAPKLYIQRATYAASEASNKKQRNGFHTSIDDEIKLVENLKLMGELDNALISGHLLMHHQPKVVAATGVIDGVEALMRWQHPIRGNIPPGMFIPYAENSTLIDQITYFAIDQSLAQLTAWEKNGLKDIRMAVNISTRNLLNPDFVTNVTRLLDRHGVGEGKLELEITESSFIEDMASSIAELTNLAKANIILSIDDFGTGYSSLQYLEKMPVSIIKIDQTFIRSLRVDPGSRKIVEAAIDLVHDLGMKVVAEGVETRDCYDYLARAGCDLIQGYFVSPPAHASELEKIWQDSKGQLVQV